MKPIALLIACGAVAAPLRLDAQTVRRSELVGTWSGTGGAPPMTITRTAVITDSTWKETVLSTLPNGKEEHTTDFRWRISGDTLWLGKLTKTSSGEYEVVEIDPLRVAVVEGRRLEISDLCTTSCPVPNIILERRD